MEIGPGTDLHAHLSAQPGCRFHSSRVAVVTKQLVGCIAYCHALGVVHRDLKMDNVLIDPRTDRLAARSPAPSLWTPRVLDTPGTHAHAYVCFHKIQAILGGGPRDRLSIVTDRESIMKLDIYAIGVMAHAMLYG
eukprot:gene14935-11633_t